MSVSNHAHQSLAWRLTLIPGGVLHAEPGGDRAHINSGNKHGNDVAIDELEALPYYKGNNSFEKAQLETIVIPELGRHGRHKIHMSWEGDRHTALQVILPFRL